MRFDPNYRPARLGSHRPAVTRAAAASAAATIAQPLTPTHQPVKPRFAPTPKKRSFWQKIQLPLIVFGGTLAGFLIQTMAFGMAVIAAYGIYAFVARVPSRTTFMLAALSVGTVACLLLLKPDPELATNFSTYTFLLLVIGVIALLREGRPLKRRKRSRARRRRL